jgi:hypothetical protein
MECGGSTPLLDPLFNSAERCDVRRDIELTLANLPSPPTVVIVGRWPARDPQYVSSSLSATISVSSV